MTTHPPAASSALPQYLIAFPDFGELDIVLSEGSEDISWKNNTSSSFDGKRLIDGTSVVLYVDYRNVPDRDVEGGKRFTLQLSHSEVEPGKVVVSRHDYRQVRNEVGYDTPPLQRPDERLVEFGPGAGTSAWRGNGTRSRDLFALVWVKNATSMAIPCDPQNDQPVFAVFDVDGGVSLVGVELAGRAVLNGFYDSHVGYLPDQEPGGPTPIQKLRATLRQISCFV